MRSEQIELQAEVLAGRWPAGGAWALVARFPGQVARVIRFSFGRPDVLANLP
jgi:hypothetical protein